MIHLSQMEQEILVVLATGPETSRDIARALGITDGAAKAHLYRLREKTGARNQVQLLRWAIREALQAARPVVLVVRSREDHGQGEHEESGTGLAS